MPTTTVSDIRRVLRAYLSGSMIIDDLDAWLDENTWSLDQIHQTDAYDLSRSLSLVLAEYALGHLTEAQALVALHDVEIRKNAGARM